MRRIRKIVAYACTTCFALFSDARQAREHARAHPVRRAEAASRPRKTQTAAILDAIGKGARTAEAVAKQTKIPLERVHSLLSYHRRKGNVKGYTGDLKLAR